MSCVYIKILKYKGRIGQRIILVGKYYGHLKTAKYSLLNEFLEESTKVPLDALKYLL